MPRKARLDAPGTLHHVIIRGIERRPIVDDDKDRENFVLRLGQLAAETETGIFAWTLMTNHAHILIKSGSFGLPNFMRRLLTGYAVTYNLRHRRHGHLFQNRYKSIVCEEDPYFKELVRYIHLNPIRANMVQAIKDLDRYRWSGHGAIVGKVDYPWMDCDYVLRWFGETVRGARISYREFVKKGIEQGHRPELVGGGLVRSLGGWSIVKAIRKAGVMELSDARILGSGEFVQKLIDESDENSRRQFKGKEYILKAKRFIKEECRRQKISYGAMTDGSRNRSITKARAGLAQKLLNEYGLTKAETARQLGVSTSAISKQLSRQKEKS